MAALEATRQTAAGGGGTTEDVSARALEATRQTAAGGGSEAAQDNASLLTILQSIHPDEWTNLCERLDPYQRGGEVDAAVAELALDEAALRRCASPCAAPTAPSSPSGR